MANNRLFIRDETTGEEFMLCRGGGGAWYFGHLGRSTEEHAEALDEWLQDRDLSAAYGYDASTLTLRAELDDYFGRP